MKSKKILFQDLEEIDPKYFKGANLDHPKIGNETYGRKSCIYISLEKLEDRRPIERKLEKKGHKVMEDYAKGWPRIEVQVSYFKGWHWDE